ncbi:restriction endonuclease subunit S [Solidesulfovibrio carbinolicus]|nr:restriction endonuclease subunit S [Solidesulfovibrio carbinolicus]
MQMTLGEIVDVIRCQLPRQRTGGGKGWLLCQEVAQANFEAISGLVEGGSENVWIELDPDGKQRKYLIQSGDVLFSFRGTGGTLGQVGLYIGQKDDNVVCGQSLCILRPKNVDVIWFYHFMRKKEIRDKILSMASGDRLMTINLSNLRDFLVEMPTDRDILEVYEKHTRILEMHEQMNILRKELIELMQ